MRQLYLRLGTSALVALLAAWPADAQPAHRVGQAGITVQLPAGWHSTRPVQGRVTNPLTRIAVSSGPIRPRLTGRCDAQVAGYAFPKTAVAIVAVEWTEPLGGMKIGVGPRRPRRFTAANLQIRRPPAIECFDGPGGGTEFAEHGRSLAVYVLLGRKAPARLVARARAVLDTLRVTRR